MTLKKGGRNRNMMVTMARRLTIHWIPLFANIKSMEVFRQKNISLLSLKLKNLHTSVTCLAVIKWIYKWVFPKIVETPKIDGFIGWHHLTYWVIYWHFIDLSFSTKTETIIINHNSCFWKVAQIISNHGDKITPSDEARQPISHPWALECVGS